MTCTGIAVRVIEGADYIKVTADEIRRQSLGHVFPPRTPSRQHQTEARIVRAFFAHPIT